MINSSSNKKIIKKHYLPFITHPRPQPLTTYAHKQQVKAQDEMLSEKVWKPDKGGYVNNKDDTESDDSDDSEGRKNNNKEQQQRDYVRIQEGAIIPEPIDDREYMELALDTAEQKREEYLEEEKEKKEQLKEGPDEIYDIQKAFKLAKHAQGKKKKSGKSDDKSDESSSDSETDVSKSSAAIQSKPAAKPKGKTGKGQTKQPAQQNAQIDPITGKLLGGPLIPADFDINILGPDYTCLIGNVVRIYSFMHSTFY